MKQYPHLFSPIKVGTLTLKNRIALAPMSFTKQAPGGGFSDECIAFTEAVARGGAGLVTLGEANIGLGSGKTHEDIIMLGDPKIVSSLYKVAEAVHRHGCAISIELSHGGAMAPPSLNNNQPSLAPCRDVDRTVRRVDTGAPLSFDDLREMTREDMDIIAGAYAGAVELLKRAGFDMAQIHMGHGWLLHQFLSPLFNRRTDEFGGSVENRARFPIIVLDRIRERVGADFPLDIRISGSEAVPDGISVSDAARSIELMQDRLAMASISCGGIFNQKGIDRMSPSVFLERGCNVYLAEQIKSGGAVRIPISTVGALSDPDELEAIIATGKADVVTMGRQLIADHEYPNKLRHGMTPLHCLRCNVCQDGLFNRPERYMRCSIDPAVGFERNPPDAGKHAKTKKKVCVVGGGPAGLMAAKTAATRGHSVILIEKSNRLGGALRFSDYVPFKWDVRAFRDQLILDVTSSPDVEVRLNTEATAGYLKALGPDAVIAAVGARHIVPPIPGVGNPNVLPGSDVYGREDGLDGDIVILGGGLVGVETAVYLADMGKNVTVVEMAGNFAVEATQGHRNGILNRIEGMENLKILVNTRCTEIRGDDVVCETEGGQATLPADHVILALGMRPDTDGAFAQDAGSADFALAGDCLRAGKIKEAVAGGFWAAYDL